jgi:hypothetical protein
MFGGGHVVDLKPQTKVKQVIYATSNIQKTLSETVECGVLSLKLDNPPRQSLIGDILSQGHSDGYVVEYKLQSSCKVPHCRLRRQGNGRERGQLTLQSQTQR